MDYLADLTLKASAIDLMTPVRNAVYKIKIRLKELELAKRRNVCLSKNQGNK